jgi:dihydrodipicolinate synthase/N-acetylneuraminate lyase
MLIEGVFAAVTTPFYADERVYLRKLEANMNRYSRSLLAGMVVLGSTGEAVMLDDAESREVLRVAAEASAPEKVLIAGVSRESVKATVEMAEAAAQFGYDAVLVRSPIYYASQSSESAILHFFRCVADRSPLPVLLYNIPAYVPYQIPAEMVRELAMHPNICGIKDSSGSVERIRCYVEVGKSAPLRTVTVTQLLDAVTSRMLTSASASFKTRRKEIGFQVLTGSASAFLESLEAGASGGILGFAACAPQACQEVYLGWKEHDLKLAREKQEKIALPSQRIVAQLGLNGVKYACDFNGYYGGRARAPLLPLKAAEKAEIEGLLFGIRS